MHLPSLWRHPTTREPLPDLARRIGRTDYRTADSELLAEGRGPVHEAETTRIEVEPFPDRFDTAYGRRYLWHLLRDGHGHYFLVVNRRDIKPVGALEAACRWVSASHVFVTRPERNPNLRLHL
ncbi:MAG: hypothetical protein WAM30_14545 [Candidatus Dormiibacterota bacterium]